ncbi:MAG: site-specific integrase [Lachnospiraceae bacterium]|nr:site-specific integrase [Lachnospiraceae bacterium]
MAGKRKDSNGIVLNKGERQMSDGRYRYRYIDNDGGQHDIYSWTLRPEDKTPDGKKPGVSLREQEKQIQKDLIEGVKSWQGSITLNAMIEEYLAEQKPYWSDGTKHCYRHAFQKHIKPSRLGRKKVSKITSDDITKFYDGLLHDKEEPIAIATVRTLEKIINPALKKAVKKNIIRFNPATGCLGEIKKKNPDMKQKKRHALENEQLQRLLAFTQTEYPQYYNFLYALAWTGCRINELTGLLWAEVDFDNEVIHIRRSLQYTSGDDGKLRYKLKSPKTSAGCRDIPMLADMKRMLRKMHMECKILTIRKPEETSVDDLDAFVFRSPRGRHISTNVFDVTLHGIVKRYNQEHEESEQLPDISAHVLRHTFCCWLCENVHGENATDDLKYIQSIMGHTDAATTLNIYSECRRSNNNAKNEALKRISQNQ